MFFPDKESGKSGTWCEGSRPIRLAGSTLDHRAPICGFFNSPQESNQVRLPYIKEGLERGEKAVNTINPHLRDEAFRLGIANEIGVLVTASRRSDFPDANERLLLNVAANQGTIGLRQTRLLGEQRRRKVDQKVSQRTEELQQRNTEVKKLRDDLLKENVAQRKEIENRERTDNALRRSQFYPSEDQRLAHMGSWAFNPSGFFEHWSEELFQIYGLDLQKGAPTLAPMAGRRL